MAPPQMAEQPLLGDDFLSDQSNLHLRRYSQSHVISVSSAKDSLTVPYTRGRSFSTSVVPGSSLAAQILATVNNKLKTNEEYDDPSFLEYMDGQIHETWDTAKALMLGSKRLLLIEELPKDRQENQYVLSGYRFYRNSKDCLRSLFSLHNETMNIWSHLLGFFFFLYLSVNVFQVCFFIYKYAIIRY
jgi:adiponectin receptor